MNIWKLIILEQKRKTNCPGQIVSRDLKYYKIMTVFFKLQFGLILCKIRLRFSKDYSSQSFQSISNKLHVNMVVMGRIRIICNDTYVNFVLSNSYLVNSCFKKGFDKDICLIFRLFQILFAYRITNIE